MPRDPLADIPVEQVPIAEIQVGIRRRQHFKGIPALARDIAVNGLLHPILVRKDRELVFGGRRLEACRRLGWKTIRAQCIDKLSDEALRRVELAENVMREDLNDYETSRARVAEMRQEAAKRRAEGANSVPGRDRKRPHRATGRKKGPRGKKKGSRRDVAAQTGVSPQTQARRERHVELAEQYPFLQQDGWVMHSVLRAGEALEELPTSERDKVAMLLDAPAIPPDKAIAIIETMAKKDPEARAAIYRAAKSDDPHERSNALAAAAALPPLPDPAISLVSESRHFMVKAAKVTRLDKWKGKLAAIAEALQKTLDGMQESDKARRTLL